MLSQLPASDEYTMRQINEVREKGCSLRLHFSLSAEKSSFALYEIEFSVRSYLFKQPLFYADYGDDVSLGTNTSPLF